jgi:hypothetical protein
MSEVTGEIDVGEGTVAADFTPTEADDTSIVADPPEEAAPSTEEEAAPEQTYSLAEVKAAMSARDQQLHNHYSQLQAQQTDEKTQATELQATETAEGIKSDDHLRSLFGKDDVGQQTYEMVEEFFTTKFGKQDVVSRSEASELATTAAANAVDGIKASLGTQAEIQRMVSTSAISTDDAKLLGETYANRMSDPGHAQAAQNPQMAALMLNDTFANLVKNGSIKPHAPRKEPVLQAGINGGTEPVRSKGPTLTQVASRFDSLRSLGADKLKAAQATSNANYEKANTLS